MSIVQKSEHNLITVRASRLSKEFKAAYGITGTLELAVYSEKFSANKIEVYAFSIPGYFIYPESKYFEELKSLAKGLVDSKKESARIAMMTHQERDRNIMSEGARNYILAE